MADLIEWTPPATKGNFIVGFIVWLVRVWAMAALGVIVLYGGAFVLFVIFLRLIGAVHGPLW